MATYYVRTDGSNTNTGTGSGTGAAWATVAHALGGTGTASGVVGGDVIYIAPGRYAGVTVGITPSSVVSVIGDPSAAQFASAIPAGPIYITNNTNDRATFSGSAGLTLSSKNNFSFANIVFGGISSTTSHNLTFDKCFVNGFNASGGSSAGWTFAANTNANLLVKNCYFYQYANRTIEITCANHASPYTSTIRFENTYIQANSTFNINNASGLIFTNCNTSSIGVTGTVASSAVYQNSIVNFGTLSGSFGVGNFIEDYNVLNNSSRGNVASGSNSVVTSNLLNYGDYMTITGTMTMPMLSPPSTVFNQLIGYGTTTNAPATDYYGATYGTPMTVGPVKSQTLTGAGIYQPIERNASAITIAPGSTSQSIELYLGATGLTFATSGLAAYYVRNQSTPVAITLVTQTPTGAWTSGGFAEISSSLVPGVYRLDVPDAAFAAGASDVTIVVRGASGTNGAVLTVTLSSGGLTEAQTAGAVWNAVRATYPTAGTFGEYVNVNVNSGAIADAVWDEARSGHTTVGTFGQYVNAELVTPVTSAALVRMGPFEVRADGLGASDPLDIQKGAQHGIDVQCVDNNNAGIDITSATVTAKVYNSGATLVDTYACTATYAADGRATFTIDTTVTDTPGTYTATITRTTGASDTQVFGPLRIYVRDI
jgi:hypothetical protein